MQKYFLAIIPPQPCLEEVERLKEAIRQHFGSKYALKSPAHVTLKMPFSFSARNEEKLKEKLKIFIEKQNQFEVKIQGTGTFGKRVIYLKVDAPPTLFEIQQELNVYCQRELHLMPELSDRNYHPHMTVAFRDIKQANFEGVYSLVKEQKLDVNFKVEQIYLLKRQEGRWTKNHGFSLLN